MCRTGDVALLALLVAAVYGCGSAPIKSVVSATTIAHSTETTLAEYQPYAGKYSCEKHVTSAHIVVDWESPTVEHIEKEVTVDANGLYKQICLYLVNAYHQRPSLMNFHSCPPDIGTGGNKILFMDDETLVSTVYPGPFCNEMSATVPPIGASGSGRNLRSYDDVLDSIRTTFSVTDEQLSGQAGSNR